MHESVPKVKPYQPTVLTEKSNLKVASSCTKHLEISQLKEPPKPSAGSEEEMKLEINCDLNRRVEEKLKQHYQAGSTRVFLSFGERLTMRRYLLKD